MNDRPLQWKNLLDSKCPKCKRRLWFDESEPMIICPSYECGFMVEQKRMQEIINKLLTRRLEWDSDLEGAVDNSVDS